MGASPESLGKIPSIAELLKETRLRKKERLGDIAARLRISERYLMAIEENNVEALPEQVYTLGFVRSYALYLDLSASEILEQYKQENYPPAKIQVLRFPEPVSTIVLPKFWLVLTAGLLAFLACGIWYFLHSPQDADLKDIHEPPLTIEDLPAPISQESSEIPATIDDTEPLLGEKGAFLQPAGQEETAPEALNAQAGLLKYGALVFDPGQKFSIKTDALSWLEVHNGQGQVLISRNLKPGESVEFEAQPGMRFSTGNAGGLRFVVQGRTTGPLGKHGEILRNQSLRVITPHE